jgi:hypothetical protein
VDITIHITPTVLHLQNQGATVLVGWAAQLGGVTGRLDHANEVLREDPSRGGDVGPTGQTGPAVFGWKRLVAIYLRIFRLPQVMDSLFTQD